MTSSNDLRRITDVEIDQLLGSASTAHLAPDAGGAASTLGLRFSTRNRPQEERPNLVAPSAAWQHQRAYQYPLFGQRSSHFAAFTPNYPRLWQSYHLGFGNAQTTSTPTLMPAASTCSNEQSSGENEMEGLYQHLAGKSIIGSDINSGMISRPAPVVTHPGVSRPSAAYSGLVVRRPFDPSIMKQEEDGLIPRRPTPPIGTKYRGDLNSFSFTRQVHNLPDEENCSLWITGIPTTATRPDIFNSIRTGSVVALHLRPPTATHRDLAAKIVFKLPTAAAAYLFLARSQLGAIIHGQRVNAVYNHHGVRQHPYQMQSRVLLVTGPTQIMTMEFWNGYFERWSRFQWDSLGFTDTQTQEGVREMFFAFERIDGQAQTCLTALLNDERLAHLVRTRYGPDPCDIAELRRWMVERW